MPMTVVATRNVAPRVRGFLASVMCEVAPGVYQTRGMDLANMTFVRGRTGWIVGPAMAVEATTGLWLAVVPNALVARPLIIASMVLLGLIWLSTAAVQAPLHRRLARGADAKLLNRLVATNWWRTAAWSGRTKLVLAAFIMNPAT